MSNENQSSEVKTKNITFGLVISWIVGVLLAITGITSLFTDTVTGIFVLIAAFITLPFGNDIIRNKFKLSLSKGLRIFLVILLVVIGVSFSSTNKNPSITNTGSGNIKESVQTTPIEYIKVSALKLSEDYKANEVAADTLYKGKHIEVSGSIENIAKDIMDTAYITLKTDLYSIVGVQCMFEKNSEQQLATLSKGQSIILQGVVSGKMMNVILNSCNIKN